MTNVKIAAANEKAKQIKEMNEERNKIAKRAFEEETKAYRDKLAAERAARDQDAIIQKKSDGMTKDEHGREITFWDKLMNEANKAIHAEQNAYNDWRSAMMSLLSLYSTLVKAMHHSIAQTLDPIITTPGKQLIREKALYPLKDRIMDALRGDPRVDLPVLFHDLQFTDENGLDFSELNLSTQKQLDKLSPTAQKDIAPHLKNVNTGFRTLVSLWLKDEGFVPAQGQDGMYVSDDGNNTLLTKAKFDQIKSSFDAFVQGSGLQASPTPLSTTPIPRPF